jgi:predicted nucleic acid-binding protein
MRKVIVNTTPILSLLKINKLHLLNEIYGSVIIPHAVYLEIESGKGMEFYEDLNLKKWIEIKELKVPELRFSLKELDDGEAEVLILAKELDADLVVIDETLGRLFAGQMGLKIAGTIGILLKAKELGLVENVGNLLLELISKGVWISPKLVEKAKLLAKE